MDLRLALLLLFTVSMALARNHAKFGDLKKDQDFMDNNEADERVQPLRDLFHERGCTACHGQFGQTHASCCTPKKCNFHGGCE